MSLRRAVCAGAIVAAEIVWPTPAAAHGLVGRGDLPLPLSMFGWAGAVVLVLPFAALGMFSRDPRLLGSRVRPILACRPRSSRCAARSGCCCSSG